MANRRYLASLLMLGLIFQPTGAMQNVLNYIQANKKPVAVGALGLVLLTPLACKITKYYALKFQAYLQNRPSTRQEQLNQNLIFAVQNNEPATVTALLAQGADVNAQTPSEKSLLWIYKHRNRGQQTPLMIAIKNGYALILKILLQVGADIDLKDERGRTALMHLFTMPYIRERREVIDILNIVLNHIVQKYGQEKLKQYVNEQDSMGRTALMHVILLWKDMTHWQYLVETVKILLESGADLAIKNTEGKRAQDYVNDYGQGYQAQMFEFPAKKAALLKLFKEHEYKLNVQRAQKKHTKLNLILNNTLSAKVGRKQLGQVWPPAWQALFKNI